MSGLHRRMMLAAPRSAVSLRDDAGVRRHDPAQRVLRPDARALQGLQRGLRRALEGEDRRDRDHPAVARRLRQAGARGDRRPGRRRGDAGAGRRHRRDRRASRQAAEGLADAAAAQQHALHLDHRVPGAQGQPEGHQGLGRPGQAGRAGDHAQPEDLGRRALELSRRLWLGAATSTAATRPRPGVRRRRSTATCRCSTPARAARPRPSPSAASATCCSPGRTRPIWRSTSSAPTSSRSSYPPTAILAEPPVAVVDAMSTPRAPARCAEAYLEYLYTPEGQAIVAKNYLPPGRARAASAERPRPVPQDRAGHDRRRVRRLEEGAGRRTSPTAACSTRSTSRPN